LKIFNRKQALHSYLDELRSQAKTIGFVPTMGALHAGHLSLIEQAKQKADIIVCSIFVNPTQFNDKKDLENYPRPVEDDIKKLEQAFCDILFIPEVDEMYNSTEKWSIELDNLDNILEGKIRPGHYQGVTQIVKKLFDIIKPDFAFFGQKDYQQYMVISYMVKKLRIKVKLVLCAIIREKDGLAMSSRNIYLSPQDRQNSLALFHALSKFRDLYKTKSISQLKIEITSFLKSAPGIEMEYFEIFNAKSFQPASSKRAGSIIALVAAKVGSIRIIDNMIIEK
jgi:pantoate--beta-alanine ligase